MSAPASIKRPASLLRQTKKAAPAKLSVPGSNSSLTTSVELILNRGKGQNHLQSILPLFEHANGFVCIVAFARQSGWEQIAGALETAVERGMLTLIVVGLDFFQTEPNVLKALLRIADEYPELVHFFVSAESRAHTLHPKVYLFHYEDKPSKLIVGSANLTAGGLCSNHEMSLMTDVEYSTVGTAISDEIIAQFQAGELERATENRINQYALQRQMNQLHHQAAQVHADHDWLVALGAQVAATNANGQPYLPTLQAWLIKMKADLSPDGFAAQQVARKKGIAFSKSMLSRLRTMADPKSDFLTLYNQLLNGGGWHSGGLHRGKSFMVLNADEFKKGLTKLHSAQFRNPSISAGDAYTIVRAHILKVKGAAMNVTSEILHSENPNKFAVMNQNSVRGMRMAGFSHYPEEPDLKNVSPGLYENFCDNAEQLRVALGLASLSELDALFNYAYWR